MEQHIVNTVMTKIQAPHLEEDAAVDLLGELEHVIMGSVGMPPPLAAPLAKLLCEGLRERLGGCRVYVPAPRSRPEQVQKRVDRDAGIAAMYNGSNLAEVMRKFQCGRHTVWRAVKKSTPVDGR